MNRRGFLKMFGIGAAAVAAAPVLEKAIPLGRVWSFPSRIVVPGTDILIHPGNTFLTGWEKDFSREFAVGSTINIRIPQRFIVRDGLRYEPLYPGDKITIAEEERHRHFIDGDWSEWEGDWDV